ncbi:hypothetical protein MED297_16589 [Reinekea blandensis MED297]|uniref:ABM domain-containing protein n=2 Tax=Reinekea TaxID=230494 RepID=A4BHH8_9GAMM|nr:hypothetical protein MED297_16589 [Reinekea blandensis MED297]
MPTVQLTGYIDVPENLLNEVLQALPDHVHNTRAEPGCLAFNVTQQTDRPTRFDVTEQFIDRQAFESHQQRVRLSDWGRLTVDVERYYEVTEHPSED